MSYSFDALAIPEVKLIRTRVFKDPRGFFMMTYRRSVFVEQGLGVSFVQDNISKSTRGVLRGLHYQLNPAAQGKLVMPLQGVIYDVAVDLRAGSPTYGRWVGETLEAGSGVMMYIPEGFAHGFCVLSDEALFMYKVTAEYAPDQEQSVRWNDVSLNVDWPVKDPVLSGKDEQAPDLQDAVCNFVYNP